VTPFYGEHSLLIILFAEGNDKALRQQIDSLLRAGGDGRTRAGLPAAAGVALRDGRLNDFKGFWKETLASVPHSPDDEIYRDGIDLVVKGPSPAALAQLDSAIARIPFKQLPMVDRPYLLAAGLLARAGEPEKARAMLARYHAEMTDTSIARDQQSNLHQALGEVELAAGNPQNAIAEFRRGDVGYDGAPANECTPCMFYDIARAYDAARRSDSAAVYFERYLSTPFWAKMDLPLDPVRVPAIRERLGQLYESMGNTEKAVENYRKFIDLWKNADPELQPRVADARKRLARLTPVESPRS